jgi:hypothetical protein
MKLPPYLTQVSGPSFDQRTSVDESYDYSVEDELAKQQDEVNQLRGAKFAANYSGDIPSAVGAGSRIRGLLDAIRSYQPQASEMRSMQPTRDLVRLRSRSTSQSQSGGGGSIAGHHNHYSPGSAG